MAGRRPQRVVPSRDTMKKKILFVTGTRADFGKLKSLMKAVEQAPDFECFIFVTGMHLLARQGHTYDEVIKCGFKNVHLYLNQMHSVEPVMDLVLADTITGFGYYVREFRPDLI